MIAFRSARRRVVLLAPVAAALLAVTAPAAGARVIATSVRGFEGGPALASDGRVVVGELRGNGALRFLAVQPSTGAMTQLTTTAPLADPLTTNSVSVSGTGGIVTATIRRTREATGVQSGPEQDIPVPRGARALALLPAVAPLLECARRSAFSQFDAAGGDDVVASIGDECSTTSTAVTIRTTSGPLRIPVTPDTTASPFGDPPTPRITVLRAAGPMVAWVEERRTATDAPIVRTIVVARGATGQVLVRTEVPGFPSQVGLGPDGTVAFTADFCVVGVVSPAAPALRAFRLPAELCPYSQRSRALAVAGGRIVYGASTGYAISDLNGVARPLAEAVPRGGNVASEIAFDGRTVFVVRPDCDADRLLAVDADAAADPLPPVPQAQANACPVRRSGAGRVRVARDGRARIALRCANGCRGTLRLVQQRRGRRERVIGEAAYTHGPGTAIVRLRIAAYARSLAGCSGGLRADAVVFGSRTTPQSPGPRGLGAYRLVSSAECRRSGGPAFARPRRGPRP